MYNIKIPQKNKSLSLFRKNAFSLNKNFDDLHHLLVCTKKNDIRPFSEPRINLNLNNFSFEFTVAN